MAEREGFKHITVTAPEEDDVVILAGVGQPPLQEAGALEPLLDSAEQAAAGPVADPEIEPAVAPSEESRANRAPERREPAGQQRAARAQGAGRAAGQEAAERSGRPPKREGGGYRETTLEDLERQPMPFAQRVVIIAAVVCIIGAVIYCLAFMG